LEEAGWKVQADSGRGRTGLLLRRGRHHYAATLKLGAESRRDRLIPLLAASAGKERFPALSGIRQKGQ
jgi:hypothetical protein